jgi:hypothetical protein
MFDNWICLQLKSPIGYIINDIIFLLNNNRWRSIIEIVLSKIVNLITSYQVTNFLALNLNFKSIDNLVLNCHIFISLFMHIYGVQHIYEEEIWKVCHSKYAWMNFGLLSNILYVCVCISWVLLDEGLQKWNTRKKLVSKKLLEIIWIWCK